MKSPRYPKRIVDSEGLRDGVQSVVSVELAVLAGVEHVETSNPAGDSSGEQQDSRIK